MVKILTNQSGTKGFNFEEFFITDPYVTECMRSTVDPKKYYGLTDEQLIHFKHLKPLEEEPQPTYEELVKDLKGMSVGEKYNVDEMMQDIEILRYE
tara:strand:+ start:34 stop:321 length:288 start_codon:yes stop_codon:yes gene_type:complete